MGKLWVGDLQEGAGASSSTIGSSEAVGISCWSPDHEHCLWNCFPFPATTLEPLRHMTNLAVPSDSTPEPLTAAHCLKVLFSGLWRGAHREATAAAS